MLRLDPPGPDLWDCILPEELKKLPEELAKVDELLRNPRFMEPFLKRFNETMGRPTVPVASYLRLMYLKVRYKLGYETLVAEVSDSIAWRRFCGIGYQERVPDSTTLIKLTQKYGDETLQELHRLIIQNLVERKIIRGRKIRIDSTVVASDIHYPTDAGLLADGLRRLRQGLLKVPGLGLRVGRTLTRVKRWIFAVAQVLRQPGAKARQRVRQINRQVLRLVRKTVSKVKKVLRRVKDRRIRQRLEMTLGLTERVADQSQERLDGGKPKDRLVSLVDAGARPIVKGKLDKPVEFGRVAQITQDESGYFTDAQVHEGNPEDSTLLLGIVATHQEQFPGALDAIATDTGFASAANHAALETQGVRWIGIPWRGQAPPAVRAKHQRAWYKALHRFRAGIEGSISFLSRKFGFKRSLLRGNTGTRIWVTWGILAANLYRFGRGP
jgi:IS5 family transposase